MSWIAGLVPFLGLGDSGRGSGRGRVVTYDSHRFTFVFCF